MTYVKTLSAVALIVATFPFTGASAQGWGPCTPSAGIAVGAAGPAMNGGQLLAGVGQCAPVGGYYGYGWGGGPYGGPYAWGGAPPRAAVRGYGYGGYYGGGPYYGGPYASGW